MDIGVVSSVTIFRRHDLNDEIIKNLTVRVGFTKFSLVEVHTLVVPENEICSTYEVPGKDGEAISLDCKHAMKGQYVSVQLVQESYTYLTFGEIEIYGQTGKY